MSFTICSAYVLTAVEASAAKFYYQNAGCVQKFASQIRAGDPDNFNETRRSFYQAFHIPVCRTSCRLKSSKTISHA